jgi:hypothetical protein
MRRKMVALAVAALTAVGVMAGASPALAINRVDCTRYDFLWLYSPQTTCWANAGTVPVALYDVTALSAGNNAGFLLQDRRRVYFVKNQYKKNLRGIVDEIHIN